MTIDIRITTFLSCTAVAAFSGSATATTYYVDASVSPGSGTSWSSPFHDPQDAIDAVYLDGSGPHLILIAQGAYKPAAGSFSIDDNLDGDLTIQGGYRGGSVDPDDRDIDAFPTILSGDISGDDPADFMDNSEHVVFIDFPDQDVTIDGLTITAGYAVDSSIINGTEGGGVLANLDSTDLTLSNLTIQNNYALDEDFGGGGGIAVFGFGELVTVSNCDFLNNSAAMEGGGAQFSSVEAVVTDCNFDGNSVLDSNGVGGGAHSTAFFSSAPATYTDCTFTDNISAGIGGGIDSRNDVLVTIVRGTFAGNSAGGGGGAVSFANTSGGTLDVQDSQFTCNTTDDGAGGAIVFSGDDTGSCLITGSDFTNNSSGVGIPTSAGAGGALASSALSMSVTDCDFIGNQARLLGGAVNEGSVQAIFANCLFEDNKALFSPSSEGGAVRFFTPDIEFLDCRFRSNEAGEGGAVHAIKATPTVMTMQRCLLFDNTAFSGPGGGLLTDEVAVTLFNCVFASNEAKTASGGDPPNGGGARIKGVGVLGTLTIVNCTFSDNVAEAAGGGLWTDATNNDRVDIFNSVFWDNVDAVSPIDENDQITVGVIPPSVPTASTNPQDIGNISDAGINISYCDIQFLDQLDTVSPGNILDDPDTIMATTGHRRVNAASRALEAADGPTANFVGLFNELDLRPRYLNDPSQPTDIGIPRSTDPTTTVIDIGAYERTGCVGDLNDDCLVDINDLGLVLGNFGTAVGPWGPGDANGDGVVDINDLDRVLGNFGECDCTSTGEQAQSGGSGGESQAESSTESRGGASELPAYLEYLGWEDFGEYAAWLGGLSQADRLIHGVELIKAYEVVGQ